MKEHTRERAPLDWATIQNNLGTALLRLGERDGTAKLEEAVAAFREALKEVIRERAPLQWAMIQNNLVVRCEQTIPVDLPAFCGLEAVMKDASD